jgi:acylphosphatase
MTAPAKTVRLNITGKVQCVGYRVWATRMATSLGLRGWVRNRSDGSVEVLATGAPGAVDAMTAACRTGPIGAWVTDVTAAPDEDDGTADFVALPTL